MNKKKLLWRLTAITLSTFMAMQMIAPFTNILAIENEKIKSLVSYGEYYNQDIVSQNEASEIITVNEDENVIVKEPVVQETTSNYSESQEVVSKRTENSKTYQVGEDQYVTELYMTPVHKKEGKEFKEIDNTLETKNSLFRSTPVYENKDGLYDVSIANGVITITTESGKTITLTPSGNLGNYAIKDNVILYSSVEDNIDVEYRIESTIIRQNIYINGAIEKANYTFDAYAPELEMKEEKDGSLSFYDGKELVYQLVAPYLSDKDGKRNEECEYTYSKNENESYQVSLSFNKDWTNATDRVYPVKARAAVAVADSGINNIIDLKTSYIRELSPTIQSKYEDLFVGYDNQFYGGPGSLIGIARAFIHFPMPNIGADQRVEQANLILYKEQGMAGEWNEVAVYNTPYVDPYTVTWYTQPSNKQLISTQNVGNPIGDKSFDITKHVQELNEGQNKTLILQSTNESPAYFCNVFNSESSGALPRIQIWHRDNYDVDPNLDINQFDNTMRVYAKHEESFEAISMDGIAKPDSKIKFDLYEKVNETDFEFVKTHTAKENSSRYFVDPIFVTNPLENVQGQEKRDVNYTTDYFRYGELPKYDTYYEYRMSVEHNGTTSEKVLYTDGFILYKVKLGDNLKTIASHYGLKIEDIKRDNNQVDDKVKEDDILFLRFAKDNPLVPADVYRPPVKLKEYEAEYVDRGPNCYGVCVVADPANTNIGNFYHESDDVTLKDFDDFQLTRVYNSYGDDISNMFGNNFASNFEQYISYTKDDDILFFRGDGKIVKIEKKDGKYVPNTSDKITFEEKEGNIEITDTRTDLTYIFDSYGVLDAIRTKNGFMSDIIYNENNMITSVKMGEKEMTFSYNSYHLVDAITLPNGVKVQYKYNEQRQLTEFIDGNGNSEKYTYDENGKIAHIVDRNGIEIANNVYDKKGKLLSQKDGTGNKIDFEYNKKETIIKYNDKNEQKYIFNDKNKIVKIEDEDGIFRTFDYDENGNLTKIENAMGDTIKYTYNSDNKLIYQSNSDNTFTKVEYDENGNVTFLQDAKGIIESIYDDNNNVISKTTTDGLTSTFTYNDKGLVASETDALGVTKTYEYTGNLVSKMTRSDGYAVEYTYDAIGNVTREADSNGRVVTYVYDNNNQVIKKTDALGQSEEYQYDGNGNIITYIDKAGAITSYTYDASNRELTSTKGTQVVSKTYDNFGRVISETSNGLTLQYEYDVRGNKVKEIDAYGNATTFTYDKVGHLLTTTDAKGNVEIKEYINDNIVKEIDKFGNITSYVYDDKNRVIETITAAGTETKIYDDKGNVISTTSVNGNVSTSEYDQFNRLVKSVSETGIITTYEYDEFNNLIKQQTDEKILISTYDVYNNKTSLVAPFNVVYTYEYDMLDRCVKEIDALGGTTTHVFNAMDNEIETIDALGNSEKTIYDQNQMVLQKIDKLGYGTTYTYDERGNVLTSTDANGVVTAYTYDKYNNVLTTTVNDTLMNTIKYDEYGRKVKEDSIVEVITYTYDQFDRVVEENNNTTGLIKTTRYDSHSNVVEESDNGGRTIAYEYDRFDQVVKTIDEYGRVETKVYDELGHVIETNSFTNEITKSTYDKYGNVLVETDKYGNETSYTYDSLNRNLTITSPKGVVNTFTYDALGRVISIHDSFTDTTTYSEFDAVGNIIKTTDALGNVTQTQYDAKGQVIKTTDALGHASLSEYDIYGNEVKTINALGHTTQKVYNAYGLIEKEIDERGFVITYIYNDKLQVIEMVDKLGNSIHYEYNAQGQIVKEINQNGFATTFEYDIYGNEIKKTDPNGNVTETKYDKLNNVVKVSIPNKETITTYDALGNKVSVKENAIVTEKNTYDEYNQVISTENANEQKTTFTYDKYGNKKVENKEGYITEYKYDKLNQMIQTIENEDKITKTTYDVLGREVSTTINDRVVSSKEYDAVGNIVSEMEDGITVKHVYDELNRVKEDQMEDMEIKDTFKMIYTYEYDESGNQTKVSDVYGNVKTKTYNAHNAVISETDANGNTSKFEYDSLNNMTKVQNALERVATYQYDGNNNLVERKIGDKKAKYEYDANDHMTYEENEYGQKLHYTYDVNGNLLSETKNDGSVIEYAYDNLGNMLKEGSRSFTYNNHNNKVSASYKNKTITYQYDKFNNIAEVKDANNNITKYKWDVYGNRIEVSTSKATVKYSYDDRNLMTSVKEGTKEVASYTYDNRGNVTSLTRDKLKSEYQYDELNRRIVFNNYKNNELKSTYTYAFDGNDNVIKEVINGKENTYTYDAMDELKTSSKYVDGKVVNTEYSYDFLGNKVEKTEDGDVRRYHYNKYNQLTNITTKEGVTDIYYDKNGNMENILYAGGQKEHYDYDEFGQLTKVTSTKDQSYEFSYDAEGDRIQYVKNVRDEYDDKTWYNYLEGLEFEEVKDLLEDKNSDDTFDSLVYQSQYHMETGSCIYPPEYSDADWYRKDIKYAVDKSLEFSEVLFTSTGDVNIYGNGERLYTKNGMNKTTYINGLNKSVYETVDMKFDFYGCRETSKEYSYTDTGYSKKHKFGYGYNGEALDDTGLIYLRARYYNPRIGQFIQLDTYKGEQNSIESQNRYAYTMNNPYKYIDPSGNYPITAGGSLAFNTWHNQIQRMYRAQYGYKIEHYLPAKTNAEQKMFVDIFDIMGARMWEVKPFGSEAQGIIQLQGYIKRYNSTYLIGKKARAGGVLLLATQEFIYLGKKVKVYSQPNGIILYSTSNSNLPDSVPSFKPSTEKNTETETNTSTGLAQGSTEFVFGVACVYVSWKVLQGLAAFALGSVTGGAGYAFFFVG